MWCELPACDESSARYGIGAVLAAIMRSQAGAADLLESPQAIRSCACLHVVNPWTVMRGPTEPMNHRSFN